jgi:hypothetical protein
MGLQQILLNLLSNAMKYTSSDGKRGDVTLTMNVVGPDLYRIEVKDTGIGIPAEDIPKLFKPFEQARTHVGGTVRGPSNSQLMMRFHKGLGLTIAKQMVELMGGELTVTSVLGEGSTFAFTFNAQNQSDTRVDMEMTENVIIHLDSKTGSNSPKALELNSISSTKGLLLLPGAEADRTLETKDSEAAYVVVAGQSATHVKVLRFCFVSR